MTNYVTILRFSSFLGFAVASTWILAAESTLRADLENMDRLRDGLATPFDEIERRSQRLLEKHSSPEDHGRIYYQLAQSYAQGGIFVEERAERVIMYAKKALAFPLDPVSRLRLYNYWGDALRMVDRTQPFPRRRKAAAAVYLTGLKESQKYEIPSHPPKSPAWDMGASLARGGPTPQDFERRRQDMRAAREKWLRDSELYLRRKVLVDQLIDIYRRKPYAASELGSLATSIVGDPDLVDELMDRLAEKGAVRDDSYHTTPKP
ncbi:MAG TPA: hypothetical protein EYP14_02810 [Planctomycetaceae bacterium]|nr:hypothetical protein [Planctomycetaceae bacterium]